MTMQGDAIGFVGLGAMGAPMVTQLSDHGISVLVYDSDADKAHGLAALPNVTAVATLGELAGVSLVTCMLPNSEIVDEVVGGEGGLIDLLAGGAMVVDMSSSDPRHTVELARKLKAAGIDLVDAPVSGGVRQAELGGLTVMFGGSAAQLERCRAVLDAVSARIVHVGDVGAAHAMKALNNVMSAVGLSVACEVIEIGRRFGLDPHTMVEVLNGSTGRNHATETKIEQFVLSESYDSGFLLRLMLKDLNIAGRLAEGVGAEAPFGDVCRALWKEAADRLPPTADQTRIATLFAPPDVARES